MGISLAGVLSIPADPNGLTVLVPWGGGAYPSSGRNRLRARLAGALAEKGYFAFRFDYGGVGESDGEFRAPDLAAPYNKEVIAACDWLASQRLDRLFIVANCFGGWSSLMAAPMISGLEGVVVVNSPVRRDHQQVAAVERSWQWWFTHVKGLTLRKLLNPVHRSRYRKLVSARARAIAGRRQRDTRFTIAVRHLLQRQIPLLLIYGNDDFRDDLESELDLGLHTAIDEAGPTTRLILVKERLEGCASLEAQDVLLREVIPWLDEVLTSSGKA